MTTVFLTYSAFVEMFEPSQDFSGYEDDGGIDILWKAVPCKNPAREAGGWCAFLWKPASEVYDGKWIRQEYNGSSPFAMWWSAMVDGEDEGECPRCKTFHCDEDDEYKDRVFWTSNTDGVDVCRACLSKE